MSRIRLSPGRLALAVLLLTGAASAAASVLVVRSSGPSAKAYPPGRSLPDNTRIVLRRGDTLTVLDARGTRTFRGPGRYNPSVAPPRGDPPAVASASFRPRVASVRSAFYVPGNVADIWQVDAATGGTHCLAAPGAPTLWRADPSRAATVNITGANGASRTVAWPAGEQTMAWPTDLAVADRSEYRLRDPAVAVPTTIRFRRLSQAPANVPAVAAALIAAGCQEQLDLLVDTVDAR
ncbi:MAG: hypothetical protein ACXWU1_02445 [Allosphingosinicella sp.]